MAKTRSNRKALTSLSEQGSCSASSLDGPQTLDISAEFLSSVRQGALHIKSHHWLTVDYLHSSSLEVLTFFLKLNMGRLRYLNQTRGRTYSKTHHQAKSICHGAHSWLSAGPCFGNYSCKDLWLSNHLLPNRPWIPPEKTVWNTSSPTQKPRQGVLICFLPLYHSSSSKQNPHYCSPPSRGEPGNREGVSCHPKCHLICFALSTPPSFSPQQRGAVVCEAFQHRASHTCNSLMLQMPSAFRYYWKWDNWVGLTWVCLLWSMTWNILVSHFLFFFFLFLSLLLSLHLFSGKSWHFMSKTFWLKNNDICICRNWRRDENLRRPPLSGALCSPVFIFSFRHICWRLSDIYHQSLFEASTLFQNPFDFRQHELFNIPN